MQVVTDTPRPLLLMDVDGVLSPFPDLPDGFEEHVFSDEEEPVRLTRVHGEWLTELGEVFEIAWATGWGTEANRLLSPFFGLPEYPVVVVPSVRFVPADKVPAVAAFAGERPAAWVDDIVTPEALEWAAARDAPTFFVETDPAIGLTRPAVDELLAWGRDVG
jgi:hypothetical protein